MSSADTICQSCELAATQRAHFLADLHDDANEKVFSSVVVVSDRNVIDAQLQDALFAFERIKGVVATKLLESSELRTQAMNNTKSQFANSPTLASEILGAVMDALSAHQTMSSQALGSQKVREGLKDVLLGPAQLYETLRSDEP